MLISKLSGTVVLVLSLLPVLGVEESRTSEQSGEVTTKAAAIPQDEPTSPLRRLIDESVYWNELFADETATTPMKPIVAMRWSNNTRGSDDGMTLLYVKEGRPEAVCCIYPWQGLLFHNFQSLSRDQLIARRDGRVIWHPESPGLTFRPIPGADSPAKTPAGRLRNMKALSKQFSSTFLGWRADMSDREALSLVPEPIYRYETKGTDVIDGTLFAFTQGTDPESLLLIECCQVDALLEWQYAFARRTSAELNGKHKDIEVWHVDAHPRETNTRSTYFAVTRPLPPSLRAEASK